MGCTLSFVLPPRTTLAKSQCHTEKAERRPEEAVCRPEEAVNGRPATSVREFHPFPRLPYELRRQIWIESLSQETPRVFALELDITATYGDSTSQYRPATEVKFAPARPLHHKLRDLTAATAASRNIGSTCREARDVTAFIFPHILEIKVYPKQCRGPSQQAHKLAGNFRFNAKRDVVLVLFSSIEELGFIWRWTNRGNLFPCAQIIQHVALDSTFTHDVYWSTVWRDCGCGKPDCVVCSKDLLLGFLRLFPNLKSFHTLEDYSQWFVSETTGALEEKGGQCECENDGQGLKHDWPVFKGMGDDEWFISYIEQSGCLYPTLPRESYGSRWPYYDTLRELDIRMLRRVTLGRT